MRFRSPPRARNAPLARPRAEVTSHKPGSTDVLGLGRVAGLVSFVLVMGLAVLRALLPVVFH